MSLINKLNNRCITNNFLKGDRGPIGPAGPPGLLPYYTIKSTESSTNEWNFDLSVLPSIISSSNGLEDADISFGYDFIIAETATTLPSSSTTPSCGKVEWVDAPSNYTITDASLNEIGSNININNTIITNLNEYQNYSTGSLLAKEVNISNENYYQSLMYYYIDWYVSDESLSPENSCTFQTKLTSFTKSSLQITKNAYTIFNIEINMINGGIPISNKYLYLYLTPTFLISKI